MKIRDFPQEHKTMTSHALLTHPSLYGLNHSCNQIVDWTTCSAVLWQAGWTVVDQYCANVSSTGTPLHQDVWKCCQRSRRTGTTEIYSASYPIGAKPQQCGRCHRHRQGCAIHLQRRWWEGRLAALHPQTAGRGAWTRAAGCLGRR